MILSEFDNISITGISVALPTKQYKIEDFIGKFGEETVRKFSDITGVKSLYRSQLTQTASDLGFEAANNLFQKKQINHDEIDLLIFVTCKPDYRLPSSVSVIHKRLKLKKECACFDINLGCSGYINGLLTAYSLLNNSDCTKILLVTGDTSIRTISERDKSSYMLFGDCGSATLIEKQDTSNKAYFSVRSDGKRFKSIIVPAGAFRNIGASEEEVLCADDNYRSLYNTYMQGLNVFNFTISDVPKMIKEFMDLIKTDVNTYDCFAFHQANLFILKKLLKKLKIPSERFHVSIDKYGNTSSNTIPLVIADRYANSEKKDLRLFLSGFGIGLSWGCVDVSIDSDVILPLYFTDRFYNIKISDYYYKEIEL